MRQPTIWSCILSMIVAIFFIANGIPILLGGSYFFALVWFLLTGTFLVRSMQTLMQILRMRKSKIERMEQEEDAAAYKHRSAASYEKQRLQKLDDLYQSGCISKEEYEKKRSQIIDTI